MLSLYAQGFNKAQIGNLYIFPDFSPALLTACHRSARPASSIDRPGFGNGYGTCAVSSSGTSSFPVELRDTWYNNTCLQEKGVDLFAFGACQPQDPDNGHIPVLANNTYATIDNTYVLRCGNMSWNLAAAQAAGIEIGSRLVEMPSPDLIVAAARRLLGLPAGVQAATSTVQ